ELGEKFLSQTKIDIYRHMLGLGDLEKSIDEWTNHQATLNKIEGGKELLIDLAKRRYWNSSEQSVAKKVLRRIDQSEWLNSVESAQKALSRLEAKIEKMQLPEMEVFDQDKFNPELEKLLNQVQEYAAMANPFMSGEAELVLQAVAVTNKLYAHAAKVIDEYSPKGVPDEFVVQFKTFMKQLTKPMAKKAVEQSRQIEKLVLAGKLQSPNSVLVSRFGATLQELNWNHPASALALPMTAPINSPSSRQTASTPGGR